MKNQVLIRKKQKEILAEFYSNFALAWFSFGLIAPVFSRIDDINKFISGIVISLIAGVLFIRLSFDTIKNIWN